MPNELPFRIKVHVIKALVEGNSIRATSRLTDVDKDVVMRLGLMVGLGCILLHKRLVTTVRADYLECDELWSYVGKHEKRKLKTDPQSWGDTYTLFAIDAESKIIPAFATGKRTLATATRLMKDLRSRVPGKPQISVDAWPDWIEAVRRTFDHDGCHLGVIVKEFHRKKDIHNPERKYSPSRIKEVRRTKVFGNPEEEYISTAIAERLNMTGRMQQRRLTRLTNAYTKKRDNLVAAFGLHVFHYNFVRVHETLETTPAVKAGVADHVWTVDELLTAALKEMGFTPPPPSKRPGRYQRKTHTFAPCPPV